MPAHPHPHYSQGASAESREAFDDHLEKYIAHVKTRAEVKKEEDAKKAAKGDDDEYEYVPLEKGAQLGPGGLDPAEVFESLPVEMQEAFGERSVEALKAVLARMPEAEAAKHMKRCVDSGLWDPTGGAQGAGEEEEEEERVAPAEVDTSPSAEVDD
jgi:cell division cycle protein 37